MVDQTYKMSLFQKLKNVIKKKLNINLKAHNSLIKFTWFWSVTANNKTKKAEVFFEDYIFVI